MRMLFFGRYLYQEYAIKGKKVEADVQSLDKYCRNFDKNLI